MRMSGFAATTLVMLLLSQFFASTVRAAAAPLSHHTTGRQDSGRTTPDASGRLFLKEAAIALEVTDPRSAKNTLAVLAQNFGGFIAYEQGLDSKNPLQMEMRISIPSAGFDGAVDEIGRIARRIDFKKIETRNITTQLATQEAKLLHKKASEQQNLQLLDRNRNLKDALLIEESLRRIRDEIAVLEAEIRQVNDRSGYGVINLTFYRSWSLLGVRKNEMVLFAQSWGGAIGSIVIVAGTLLGLILWQRRRASRWTGQ